MKKTDLIRFRCTPAFKGDVQRHADFEQITVSEYVERALENEMRSPAVQSPKLAIKLHETFGKRDVEDSPANTTTDGDRCPHGRFRWQFCGECS